MTRELSRDQVDVELACGVAVHLIEYAQITVTPDAITLADTRMQTIGQLSGWVIPEDPLHVAARDYMLARRDAMLAGTKGTKSHWDYSGAARKRDVANQKAIQLKNQARTILEERGVLERARDAGLKVFDS